MYINNLWYACGIRRTAYRGQFLLLPCGSWELNSGVVASAFTHGVISQALPVFPFSAEIKPGAFI